MTPASAESAAPDVLVVCTANEARSPLFAGLLASVADGALGSGGLRIASAGTEAYLGRPAADGSIVAARARGSDLAGHTAQPLRSVALDTVGLLVVMERAHRRAVRRDAPDALPRTLLLRQLAPASERVRDAAGAGSSGPIGSDRPARTVLDRLTPQLQAAAPRGRGRRLDVPDPIRAGQATYDTLADEFAAVAEAFVALLVAQGAAERTG